jgi:hypothetical protein
MMFRVCINVGFITNSSSVVYNFPSELLKHPDVQAFMQAMDLFKGFVGEDLWSRTECATIAITKEQKQQTLSALNHSQWGPISDSGFQQLSSAIEDDSILVVYGDEYVSCASILADMLQRIADEKGIKLKYIGYN